MNEKLILQRIKEICNNAEELEAFIDRNFLYDEDTDSVTFMNGSKIKSPKLLEIVKLSYTIYDIEEIKFLL